MEENQGVTSNFRKPKLIFGEGNELFLEEEAQTNPSDAIAAYSEFVRIEILNQEQIQSIAEKLLETLAANADDSENFLTDHLILLSKAWTWIKITERPSVDLAKVFQSAEFYSNLRELETEGSNRGLAHALFLAKSLISEEDLPSPMVRQPNGQMIATATEEFEWFNQFLEGTESLGLAEYALVADQVKASSVVTRWLGWSSNAPENAFLSNVIGTAFREATSPNIGFETFLKNFHHLEAILGEGMQNVVNRYGSSHHSKKVDKLTLASCPLGLIAISKATANAGWDPFHNKVAQLLDAESASDWKNDIINGEHPFHLLIESQRELDYQIDQPEFRATLVEVFAEALNGKDVLESSDGAYDQLIELVSSEFHPEIVRQVRDKLAGVTSDSLRSAQRAFPDTLAKLIGYGDRISQGEKDAIVRHLLCPALEDNELKTLQAFLSLGRQKVSGYISSSHESTQSLVDGALKAFGKFGEDREFVEQVTELVSGKRKAKSWFEVFWPASD